MKLYFIGILIILSIKLIGQDITDFNPDKPHHPDSIKRWTKDTMREISKKHPGFYRYTTKKRFDFLIDSTVQTVTDSLTALDFYRKLKPLFAQIGCLHTGVSLAPEYDNYLSKTATLIPIEVFINNEKQVFITKYYSADQLIPLKSEILSINDRPIKEILKTLFKAIPSDGYNETEKILLLNHRFAFWYQTIIDVNEKFQVSIKSEGSNKTYELKGVGKEVFPTMESLESSNDKQLEFEIRESIGILKIHSFAKTVIKDNGQNFKKFIKTTFKTIKTKHIQNLIVDLRYNTGGTDGNAALLASYFFDKSFRYWDKIEVTEALAKEIKGLVRVVYGKPIKKDSTYLWRKSKFTNEFNYYETQKPAKCNFNGQTYILTNGLCLSSCGDVTAILSYNKKAKVIGQESGGGFQGNTSGIIPTTKIPTGLLITIPLQKYTNAVDLNKNFGRGTIPDYEVTLTLNDWTDKKDVEMEFALKLIKGE